MNKKKVFHFFKTNNKFPPLVKVNASFFFFFFSNKLSLLDDILMKSEKILE